MRFLFRTRLMTYMLISGIVISGMVVPAWSQSESSSAPETQRMAQIEDAFASRHKDLNQAHQDLTALREQAELAEQYQALALAANYQAATGHLLSLYEETEAMLDRVLLQYRPRFETVARGRLELMQARMWRRLEQLDKASARLEALKVEFQDQDNALLAHIFLVQNEIAHLRGDFDQAIAAGLAAVRLMAEAGDIDGLIQAHKSLGVDYMRVDDLESSLFHYEQGEALLPQSKDIYIAMGFYANMGITLQALGDLDRALEAYQSTYESAVAAGRVLTQAQSLLNIATIYSNDYKDYERAIEYYRRSMEISEANDLTYGVMLNHLNIAVALGGLGRADEAIESFNRAKDMAEALDRPNEKRFILMQKSEVLAESGRFEEAYATKLEENELAEQLFNENRDRTIADLRVEYETEIAQQALALAEAKNEQQTQWIRSLSVLIVLLGLLLVSVAGFLGYRNRSLERLYRRNIELLEVYQARREARSAPTDNATDDPLKALFERLQTLIEIDALFKDEGLTLATLARQVQSNEKYVSNAISRFTDMNFATFINYYRIQEAKKLLRDDGPNVSITGVMLECGFGHKSTFYSAFKKFTGMTPTQFRAVALKEAVELRSRPQDMSNGQSATA